MGKPKILIVEDEIPTLQRFKGLIDKLIECELYEATEGLGAAEKMKAIDFDLVVLDIKMPGLNGLDVIRQVKKEKPLPDILVVSGWDSTQVAQKLIEEGALDYLPKPLDLDIFILRVRHILEKKNMYIEKTAR